MTRRARRTAATLALALAPTLGLATIVAGANPASAGTKKTVKAPAPKLSIKGFAFSPGKLTAKAGQSIAVQNGDGAPHTFTADDGSFDTGPISGGKSATVKVSKKGTFAFHCDFHPSMKGTLTVS